MNLAELTYAANVPIRVTNFLEDGMQCEDGTPIAYVVVDGPPTTPVEVKGGVRMTFYYATDEGRIGDPGIMAMVAAVEAALTELGRAFDPPAPDHSGEAASVSEIALDVLDLPDDHS